MTVPFEINNYKLKTDPVEVANALRVENEIAFDTETTGLSPWQDELAIMQFFGPTTGTLGIVRCFDGVVPDPIKDLFTDRPRLWYGHNVANFDIQFLDTSGVKWQGNTWHDTLVGECVVTTAGRKDVSMSLKAAAKRRLGIELEKGIDHGSWQNPNLTLEQLAYASTDVIILPDLYQKQVDRAIETEQTLAFDFEQSLVNIFAQMVCNGVPLIPSVLKEYLEEQESIRATHDNNLRELLNAPDINLNSPIQIKTAIKAVTGLSVSSTNKETMTKLATQGGKLGKIATEILDYREPNQRIKMYNEDWQAQYITAGFIHPKLWQCKTDTTRVASSSPNIQQVPKDGRKIIGNLPGYMIVSADYSQIEIRVAAMLAQDEVLLAALDKEDIHQENAALMYHKSPETVFDYERRAAKAASFALLFDGSAKTIYTSSLVRGGSLTMEECKDLEYRFFNTFKGLAQMRTKAHAMAHRPGPVFLRLHNGIRRMLVGSDKRASKIINTLVQGNAAVGLKYGMLEADRRGLSKYLALQVHDELVACVPEAEAEDYAKELADAMVVGMKQVLVNVPVTVDYDINSYWR